MMNRDALEVFSEPRGPVEWFLAIHAGGDPSPQTVQAWLKWLDASPENRRAFEDLVEIWDNTPAAVIAADASEPVSDEYDGSVTVAQWRARAVGAPTAAESRAATEVAAQAERVDRPSKVRWPALAACLVLSVVGAAAYWTSKPPGGIANGDFSTAIGEQRQLRLADHSTVILGPDSKLSVNLTQKSRDIRLSAGEAYFSVAKDPSRVFSVHALNGIITAVGTAFDVRAIEGRVTVTVTEGRIALTDETATASTAPRTLVSPGEQVSYSHSAGPQATPIQTAPIQPANTGDALHWQEGWLVYRNEPLRYVVADLARYTDLKLQLAPAAAEIHFSGAVRRDRIGEWIVALPEVAPVTVTGDGQHYAIDSRVQ